METEREFNQGEQDSETISEGERPQPTSTEETSTPRTYSEDEFRTLQSKADRRTSAAEQSAAAAQQKVAGLEDDYKAIQEEIRQLQSERDRAEEAGAEGDEAGLSVVRQRKQLRDEGKRLNLLKKELDNRQKDQAVVDKQAYAYEIGSRYSIDPATLMSAQSPEDMLSVALEAVAKERKKSPGVEQDSNQSNRYDTGVSDAGPQGRSFTRQQIEDMSIEEYAKHSKDIENALRRGRIK